MIEVAHVAAPELAGGGDAEEAEAAEPPPEVAHPGKVVVPVDVGRQRGELLLAEAEDGLAQLLLLVRQPADLVV